jgi:hypothetical protein
MRPDAVKFLDGERVYHKTGDAPGIVTAVIFRNGAVFYEVSWSGRVKEEHAECELTRQCPDKGMDKEEA